jgi:hypothetical protein
MSILPPQSMALRLPMRYISVTMRHTSWFLAASALLMLIACGCTSYRSRAVDQVTLTRDGPTTRAASDPCAFQLLRVEPDGTVVLRVLHLRKPETTVSGRPGQVIVLEQTSDSQWQVTIVSSDPASQQATIRGEATKTARPVWW